MLAAQAHRSATGAHAGPVGRSVTHRPWPRASRRPARADAGRPDRRPGRARRRRGGRRRARTAPDASYRVHWWQPRQQSRGAALQPCPRAWGIRGVAGPGRVVGVFGVGGAQQRVCTCPRPNDGQTTDQTTDQPIGRSTLLIDRPTHRPINPSTDRPTACAIVTQPIRDRLRRPACPSAAQRRTRAVAVHRVAGAQRGQQRSVVDVGLHVEVRNAVDPLQRAPVRQQAAQQPDVLGHGLYATRISGQRRSIGARTRRSRHCTDPARCPC